MKSKLSETWMPSENVLELAKVKGMPIEDWLYHLLPEWRLYWVDSGLKKSSWDATFWNWAKRCWQDVDKSRMYRQPVKAHEDDLRQPDPRKYVESYTTNTTIQEQSIERFNQQVKEFEK